MSDGFDKEAEREKLREKFADDEQKREHTQRMSELLLQGATMTNRHCDDCGDPIFRHDGQEFCPTCQTTGQQGGSGETAPSDAQTATRPDADPTRGNTHAGEREVTDSPPRAVENGAAPSTGEQAPPAEGARPSAAQPADTTAARPSEPTTPGASRPAAEPATTPQTGTETTAQPGAVDDARESLTRTLTRFARAAEATDDPRRARDHLRAAREAAEALRALD
ncbi:Sjogren's syndrome/scleroderma autoantigen 1 family protein [Halorubrum halophilum]|uniref:Sjogren's syndrome/scleroderma autoantigen 1 family protein n=1 Tax=Halorubrum halophilum TaxID=413816 RepID=UPI00186B036E|nr:Sjogren's syndrome/scleroderma autoantigen 1 family protein [Halorubrum halophilum]